MLGQWRWLRLAFCLAAAAAQAQNWEPNRWHHVTEGSPFYVDDRGRLQTAAIQQGHGRFAQMVLGQPDDGALVSVNLPMSEIVDELTSTLVMPGGGILVRNVDGERLVATRTAGGDSVTYSFGIAPDDVEQFMAALLWRVKAGDTLVTISLDGSRDAISSAIAARDAPSSETGDQP